MTSPQTDAARLTLALTELRLPAIKALWPRFAEQADKEGWPAARLPSIPFRLLAPFAQAVR